MTEEPDSLVLRCLRKLDEKLDRLDLRQQEAMAELRSIKTHMAAFIHMDLHGGS